jgi:hypothetical protein
MRPCENYIKLREEINRTLRKLFILPITRMETIKNTQFIQLIRSRCLHEDVFVMFLVSLVTPSSGS